MREDEYIKGVEYRGDKYEENDDWFGLVWFYGISTIVGYSMLNPFYTYKRFYFKQFSLV